MKVFILCGLLVFTWVFSIAQSDSKAVQINGKVYDLENPNVFMMLIAVNKRTNRGAFGEPDGKFSINIQPEDTLLLSARGYQTLLVCFKDSTIDSNKVFEFRIFPLHVDLNDFVVQAPKNIYELKEEVENLELLNFLETLEGVDALASPITALYQRLNKLERSKRLVAEMEYEDQKREILGKMMKIYLEARIINLHEDAIEDFVLFCDFSDTFLKAADQYQLAMAVKRKYYEYSHPGP